MESQSFHHVKVPEGCTLRRKEVFEYTTTNHVFDIELFENQNHTYYAIGVPRDAKRIMVFGTREMDEAHLALKSLVDKIRREEALIDGAAPAPEDFDNLSE